LRAQRARIAKCPENRGNSSDLGELFVNRESFDVYVCGRCGRVELFVDGIGEEFRPHGRVTAGRPWRRGGCESGADEFAVVVRSYRHDQP
jgi:hypothetical protein